MPPLLPPNGKIPPGSVITVEACDSHGNFYTYPCTRPQPKRIDPSSLNTAKPSSPPSNVEEGPHSWSVAKVIFGNDYILGTTH